MLEHAWLMLRRGQINRLCISPVVRFRPSTSTAPSILEKFERQKRTILSVLRGLMPRLLEHYPGILQRFFVIGVPKDFFVELLLPKCISQKFSFLSDSTEIASYFSKETIPTVFGGLAQGTPLVASRLDDPGLIDTNAAEEKTESNNTMKSAIQDQTATTEQGSFYSDFIGPPSLIADPEVIKESLVLKPGVVQYYDLVIKFGSNITMAEAEAMKYVSENTTIPVPAVESAYIDKGIGYILMSYIEGDALSAIWDTLDQSQKESIVMELKGYIQQLRMLKPKQYFIGPYDGSHCRAAMFTASWGYTNEKYGPFNSEEEFNEGIVKALSDRFPPYARPPPGQIVPKDYILVQSVRALHGHESVFTHADLHGGNILVKDGKIVAILDWGEAGYWPEYWEFCRAHFLTSWSDDWMETIDKWCPAYYLEMQVMSEVYRALWHG
ncbi:kinase-like protein [Ascobolus immersus RN42]|uniref:Kinase-like protein n=1 Tax=Ascobolus immersus RN42 TaxID=1160509 RepID=A0A3N4I088_ASCIM|nr:kinase-like protein [Ascobolus immersus RN42]